MTTLLDRFIGREIEDESDPEIAADSRDETPELPPDPAPAARASGLSFLAPATSGKVTPALKRRIAAELEAYIEMAALPVVMRDPTCGGAIHEQAKPLADAIAQILSRYPEIAHKFMATGVLGDWLKLFIAVTPIVKVVYGHHINPPQEEIDDAPDFPPGFDPLRPGT